MMKNKFNLRYATLRRALILPFFIGVFTLLCFTTGKSEVRYVEKKTDLQEPQNSASAIESLLPEKTSSGNTLKDSVRIKSGNNTYTFGMNQSTSDAEIQKGMTDFSNGLGNTIKKLNKILENYSTTTLKKDLVNAFTTLDIKANQQNIAGFELSDAFISSVSRQTIKNTVDNFSKIKVKMDELRKEKPSMEQTQRFSVLAVSVLSDNLISELMGDVLQKSMSGMPGMAGLQGKQFSDLFSNMATFSSKPFTTTTTTSRVISSAPGLSNTKDVTITIRGNVPDKKTAVKDEKIVENTEIKSIDNLEDDNSINTVALFDKNDDVRKEAVDLLKDQNTIKQVALFDKNSGIRLSAVALLTDQDGLKSVALFDKVAEIRKQATIKLKDLEALKQVANFDKSPEVRLSALKSLKRIEENHQ